MIRGSFQRIMFVRSVSVEIPALPVPPTPAGAFRCVRLLLTRIHLDRSTPRDPRPVVGSDVLMRFDDNALRVLAARAFEGPEIKSWPISCVLS
jgi:hypothetical protein